MTAMPNQPYRAAVVTDLDGTLLNQQRKVSDRDLETLHALRADGVVCVIATGRSLHSARRVLDPTLPLDYLLFSSGAGIMDWPAQRLIRSQCLSGGEVARIAAVLEEERISYMVHDPIPENHCFAYRELQVEDTDFRRRCEFSAEWCRELDPRCLDALSACQLIGIFRPDAERFNRVRGRLEEFSVIRATSPLDGQSMWMEIFPPNVSKSASSDWLMRRLGVPAAATHALGNDYNDIDMLAWAEYCAVTDNAPADLKSLFQTTVSHNDHALSEAVATWGLLR